MSEYVRRVTEPPGCLSSGLANLELELTERCDNDCIHCCINLPPDDAAATAREMSTGQLQDVLRQAADLGCLEVCLTGGEPLLRPDFEELYFFARQLGLKVLIFTNGRRITAQLAALWARVPPLVPLEVTVYGMHPESYEAVTRTPGSFAEFRRGVDLLLAHRVPFVVKGALLPPNRLEMEEFEAWARTIPWMDTRPSYNMFFDLRSRRDDPRKNRLIESLRVAPAEGVAVLSRDAAAYRKQMAEFAAKFMGPAGDRLFACGAGRGLTIDAYGRGQPCMGLRAPELTVDILTSPLADALRRFTRLVDLKATDPEYLRRCAVCSLHGFCAQCPAKSWLEHGMLDRPVEYLCRVAHAQARYLGWLGERENAWECQLSANTVD